MKLLRYLTFVLAAFAAPAFGVTSQEIFALVSPSVWKVVTYDVDGLPLGQGSAVVIAPETLATNCHVLAKARRVVVRRAAITLDARLEMWDPQRDVCQIRVAGLSATAVSLGDASQLAVGQTAYAIGNPKALDLTMSAGLVSSIRLDKEGRIRLIQTSAAISGGSSGGGLFDEQGRLIGLTTLGSVTGDAQNLNFAIPVDWIKDLPRRHAARTQGTAVAAMAPASAASMPAMSACVGAGKRPAPVNDADVADVSRLPPYASEKMREQYRVFLTCPLPRAFAISEGGKWWYSWSSKPLDPAAPTDPAERALQACAKVASSPCFLYAADNRLVVEPGK